MSQRNENCTPAAPCKCCQRAYGELCRAAPAGGEPNGKLVGWWNGITPGFDGMGMPSIRWGADAEDSRHDIPLYDGYNPIHYVTPVSAPAGSGEVTDGCTESNCERCATAPHARGELRHAGIGSYPDVTHIADKAAWLERAASKWEVGPMAINPADALRLRELAALLRKLQQGADYVMVPRVPTDEMETAHRMYGDTSDWWQAVTSAAIAAQLKEG